VRDDQDSLTNQEVLDEILTNITRFAEQGRLTDAHFDILCDSMYGFLNLGSKYCARGNAHNIATAMSSVCLIAKTLFRLRLDKFAIQKAAGYSQGAYNKANDVYLDGTCWSMVMDWARRIVLKEKMGYAHGLNTDLLQFKQDKLLHRGKYIAHVFGLRQDQSFDDVGAAIAAIDSAKKAKTSDVLAKYYAEQKGSKKTVEDKFSNLSYRLAGPLGLRSRIHIGNQHRVDCTNTLRDAIYRWIRKSEDAYNTRNFYLFAYQINFLWRRRLDSRTGLFTRPGRGAKLRSALPFNTTYFRPWLSIASPPFLKVVGMRSVLHMILKARNVILWIPIMANGCCRTTLFS
jgi:hypothetical protein